MIMREIKRVFGEEVEVLDDGMSLLITVPTQKEGKIMRWIIEQYPNANVIKKNIGSNTLFLVQYRYFPT